MHTQRCDGCGAHARVTVRLPSAGELLLCGSHARQHELTLIEQGATLVGDYSVAGEQASRSARDQALLARHPCVDAGWSTAGRGPWWQRLLRTLGGPYSP